MATTCRPFSTADRARTKSRHDRDPHRIRFSRPQGTTEPAQPPTDTVVVERDDGLFQIGLDDDAALSPPSPRRRGGGKTLPTT